MTPRPTRRWLAAAAILAATAVGLLFVKQAEQQRAQTQLVAAVEARRGQLVEALEVQLRELEMRGQSAGSNPRLVAALSGGVSRETLRDLFQTEAWWQPFREAFAASYLAAPGAKPVFIQGKEEVAIEVAGLVSKVRQSREVGSALVGASGYAHAVVAVPVLMPSGPPPVLLLTQPFDARNLGPIAERTGEAVLLSDGERALVGAGPAAETSVLKRAVGRERAADLGTDGASIAVHAIGPGLYLLSHMATGAVIAQATAALAAIRITIGVLGGVLFLLVAGSAIMSSRKKPAAMAPPITATLTEASSGSRYTLLQRIGGGGMAEVHLAVSVGERGFRRPCVVKRLRPELSDNPAAVAQFTDEATLASSLVHANIVPIFDFARVGSQYFLVEEYIVGRNLGRLVRAAKEAGFGLEPDLIAYLTIETLKALDYAHGKRDHDGIALGLVHRDVSPENIMITVRGEVQLLDFGVIRVEESKSRRTDVGELKGNLNFIAPEQARGQDVDARADLFSLGLVVYFALTGEPLYGVEGGYELLVRAASGPGAPELAKLARLPEPFRSVLSRVLSPRVEQRFPSAVTFAEALGPVPPDAGARLGSLIGELFGEELAEEQQHLSSTAVRPSGTGPGTTMILGPGGTPQLPPTHARGGGTR